MYLGFSQFVQTAGLDNPSFSDLLQAAAHLNQPSLSGELTVRHRGRVSVSLRFALVSTTFSVH